MARTEASAIRAGEANEITYAHSSSVSAGEVLKIDSTTTNKANAIIALTDGDANAEVEYATKGKVTLPVASGNTINQGESVYWDVNANAALSATATATLATGDFCVGFAAKDSTASGGYVDVWLNEGPDAYDVQA